MCSVRCELARENVRGDGARGDRLSEAGVRICVLVVVAGWEVVDAKRLALIRGGRFGSAQAKKVVLPTSLE